MKVTGRMLPLIPLLGCCNHSGLYIKKKERKKKGERVRGQVIWRHTLKSTGRELFLPSCLVLNFLLDWNILRFSLKENVRISYRRVQRLTGEEKLNQISERFTITTQGGTKEFETHPNPFLYVCRQEAETSGEARQRSNQSPQCLVSRMPDIWNDCFSFL